VRRPDVTRSLAALVAAAVALGAAASLPARAANEPACASVAEFHRLDFWLGSWTVVDAVNGTLAGHDVVRSILRGCAITETWTDADGSHGFGVLHYDAFANEWRKLYLSDRATRRGGVRERVLVAAAPGGGVRFQGLIDRATGPPLLNRVTITPLRDGRVHYLVATSADGGERWTPAFDVFYVRERAR
jgi:hypothetical protein